MSASSRGDRREPGRPLFAELLGRSAFSIDGQPVNPANRKSRALLGYLCLTASGRESRERIVGLLWSESEKDRALASLRQAIYEIRTCLKSAGYEGFASDNLSVWLEPGTCSSDVAGLLAAPAAAESLERLNGQSAVAENLLGDLASVDPAFEGWLAVQREVFANKLVRGLEQALDSCEDRGLQRSIAGALIGQDPTHERAVRTLMRALAADGDLGGALKTYKQLWDCLEVEFDIEPSQETQDLVAELRTGQVPTRTAGKIAPRPLIVVHTPPSGDQPCQSARQAPAAAPKIVLAIGKFEMGGANSEHGYLLQAFRRELIAQLVRFREWLVRDLNYGQGSAMPATTEYIIEASGLEQKGAARLVFTLMNVRTGDYLWSERLPLSLDAWIETQQEIVRRLAANLNVHLSAGRLSAVIRRPSADLAAYDRWLKAQTRLLTWTPDKGDEAEELLQAIIEDTPDFAPAYSSLASFKSNLHFSHPGFMRSSKRHSQAREYAEQAVRLDPLDSRAHLALGWADAYLGDFDAAVTSHRLAREINESDPWTLMSTALGEAFCSDAQQASEFCRAAFELLPSPSPANWGYRAQIGFVAGDTGDCMHAVTHAAPILHFAGWKAAALAESGRLGEARAALGVLFEGARGRWYGSTSPTPEAITRWFLHLHPIRDASVQRRLADGLVRAGAPRADPIALA